MKKIISHNQIDNSCSRKARKCLNFVPLFITVMLAMLGLCNLSALTIYHHNVSANREQIATKNEKKTNETASTGSSGSATGNKCGSVNTFFKWGCDSGTNDEDIVTTVVKSILKWMAAGVGAACMIGILVSAFLYVTAKDNASQARQAMTGLKYAIGALIVFAAAGTILNFLIPGGLN